MSKLKVKKTYKKNRYNEKYMGKTVYRNGYYKAITIGGRTNVMVHRLIWENHYETTIPEGWVCHHRDGNKLNNHIDNLEVMTVSEHRRLHMIGESNPLFRYTYTVFDENNNVLGLQEPLSYYMDKYNWNVNSVVVSKRLSNGKIIMKSGRRKGWMVIVHKAV